MKKIHTHSALVPYKTLSTEFYDLEPHRDGVAAFNLYREYALQAQGMILEPMCGTGRFLIPFLQAGCIIEGFDASPHMLAALRHKYARISDKEPPVSEQFIQNFESQHRYSLIFIPYGSWGLITNQDEARMSLANMYHHLAPDGTFIVEIETTHSVVYPCDVWRHGKHTRADGVSITVDAFPTYNPSSQIYNAFCRYSAIKNGTVVQSESEDFNMYLYRFSEMDKLLSDAGFSRIIKYQDYCKTLAINEQAEILIYECQKR